MVECQARTGWGSCLTREFEEVIQTFLYVWRAARRTRRSLSGETKTLDTDRTVSSREACTPPLPRPGWTLNTFVWRYHCQDQALDTDTLVDFVEKEEMDEADLITKEVVAVCQTKLNLSKVACLLVDHQVQLKLCLLRISTL